MVDEEILMKAVRDLRAHLDINQVSFAVKIRKSYPTVQRYEKVKPPAGKEIVPFVWLARENGRHDLAAIFKQAAIESVPEDLLKLIREPDTNGPAITQATQESPSHKRKLRAG